MVMLARLREKTLVRGLVVSPKNIDVYLITMWFSTCSNRFSASYYDKVLSFNVCFVFRKHFQSYFS